MNTAKALAMIQIEREYQDEKWGFNPHTHEEWAVIALEEAGEVARAILNLHTSPATQVTKTALLRELVQHAAVLTAWIEDYLSATPDAEVDSIIEERKSKTAAMINHRIGRSVIDKA